MANIPPKTEVTISAGAITLDAGGGIYPVGGEGAANDTLTDINGLSDGDEFVLQQGAGAEVITIAHSSGNVRVAGGINAQLNDTHDFFFGFRRGSVVIGRITNIP